MSTMNENNIVFGKTQILESAIFTPREKDVLDVILQKDQSYTLEQARQELELFLTKEVI
ncbi:hypothetical protein SAMN04487895_12818 [Paenibacillus sophorae]|uniref:Uncharacterized protein n=1 Tax=Paenibacillus sophorae TaxID=1333845 RepID=A0A1H8VWP5_9BACL|nr:hypothetical protein [Paenibacillus sophorae]QWU18569.1 hypothetical protein KP014_28055 [Paenibacillus sophorae]SEP19368.1 hypothetical protein SAMN04487895_12818 [Paenibacillus sophorae]